MNQTLPASSATDRAHAAAQRPQRVALVASTWHRDIVDQARDAALAEYQFHTRTARHYFCRTCGIYPFHRKRVTPDHFGVNVHCLADFDPTGIPVRQAVGAAMP